MAVLVVSVRRRRRRPVAALVVCALLAVIAPVASRPALASGLEPVEAGTGARIVIGTSRGGDGKLLAAADPGPLPDTAVVEVAPDDVAAAVRALAATPGVRWAEPDAVLAAALTPIDPFFVDQAELATVRAPAAWDVTTGAANVVVAVLDTAVATGHPDLAGKVVGTIDAIDHPCGPGAGAIDHGTAVAGIIGAATNNAIGIAGVGWNTRVLGVRVLCADGSGFASTIAAGIRAAVDNGAGILNLSIAPTECSANARYSVLEEAVAYAHARGAVVVAAAGNESCSLPQQPASIDGVIGVGATGLDDRIASFSNRGTWVDILAPGVSIASLTQAGGTSSFFDGTSFAAPIVAGVAALIVARFPGISRAGVVRRLQSGAAPVAGTGSDVAWGRVDAAAAVAPPTVGYWLASIGGSVAPLGDAGAFGAPLASLGAPIAAVVPTPTGRGYLVAGSNGAVSAHGDAVARGSMAGLPLNRPIVGMAATPSGLGYWLVASDGGIFSFGDAAFHGSTGAIALNQPIVGMAATPSGLGYWLVASDGGIFAFGDATFRGSMGSTPLFRPVVGMAATATGAGYWLVAADGGIFAFGDAPFRGSTGGTVLNRPVTGMVPSPSGNGYWFVARDGGVFAFGDAPFVGSGVGMFSTDVVAFAPMPVPPV